MSKFLPRELRALFNSLTPLGLFYMEQWRFCIYKATYPLSLNHLAGKPSNTIRILALRNATFLDFSIQTHVFSVGLLSKVRQQIYHSNFIII